MKMFASMNCMTGFPQLYKEQVRQELQTHIEAIVQQSEGNPRLSKIASKIKKTTNNYAPGLFHTYDVEELPRINTVA